MKRSGMTLQDVRAVYEGPEGKLWELIMGEQIHVGGWGSSMELAKRANMKKGLKVLDLCSALGAGLRFLVENFQIIGFGLDGTSQMVRESRKRIRAAGLADRITIQYGDVTRIPWTDRTFDLIWGEDAWCYVTDKDKLIAESARVLRTGGTIAFTDWIEGENGLSDDEADRINAFMKFPYMESAKGYKTLLEQHGFTINHSDDLTEDFADHIRLYIEMLTKQLTFDALNLIGNDFPLFQAMGGEMQFMLDMARRGKFGRGRWIAVKS
jgi:ubiquinone/menaquinone biosynthesis C-methylase UbiE